MTAPERWTASALSTHDAAEGSRTEPAARGVPTAANTRHHALLGGSLELLGACSGVTGAMTRIELDGAGDTEGVLNDSDDDGEPRAGARMIRPCTDHSSGASRTSESRSDSGLSHTSVWPRSSSNNSSSALNSKDGASLAQPPSGAELGSFRN